MRLLPSSDTAYVIELPPTAKIILLRHAQSLGNKDRTMQGRGDYPLSDEGRAQVHEATHRVTSWDATFFVASDLSRAYETAAILSAGEPVHTDARLTERDAGVWEGRPREALETAHPGALENDDVRPDDFEMDSAVFERMHSALSDLTQWAGIVVVIGHGATMRVLDRRLQRVFY
jgi:probable phosphoglycerate mutase